ncbi:Kae1-associated serine/threonine protein kinase [Candidatus Pacearchaeota archaeon]|nr:Kae1-associated serine/threonine protein kinase [Candidatus Pacearchaeota archaeon]
MIPKQKLIAQGAEAKIYLVSPRSKKSSLINNSQRSASTKSERFHEPTKSPLMKVGSGVGAKQLITSHSEPIIIKDRIQKSYRLQELDNRIRKLRTRSETKLLTKASQIINSPKPTPTSELYQIKMPFINGKRLSEHLDNFALEKQKKICKQIGESIAKLHDKDIIHGDLTTSNMILLENKIFFIDFGLGFISHKFEDKAVDLHLLKQALEAKHFKNWEELIKEVFKGYSKSTGSKIVFERLQAVEKRGRYKHK